MFIKLWKRMLPIETPLKPNKISIILFIATTLAGIAYLNLMLHIGFRIPYVPLYLNVLLLATLLALTSSLAIFPKLYPAIYYLISSVVFIIVSNASYAYADFADNEINNKVYVIVAIGYGFSQLLMVNGIVNFFKFSQLEKEEFYRVKKKEIRKKRDLYFSNS